MTFVHGKNTFVSVDGADLSAYTDSSERPRSADSHDVTTYGNESHRKAGGLKDGTFQMSGTYDNGVGGPRAILDPLVGEVVEIIRRPAGTGAGKAQDTFNALLQEYTESSPVADMVKWTAKFEIDGDVDSTPQA